MLFIVLAAIGTTGYTINDSVLVKICASSPGHNSLTAAYLVSFVINFGLGCTMALIVIFRKKERENFKLLISSPRTAIYPAMAGILSSLAYLLILLAMLRTTQLSFLQAFRQMSLPIGMLAGVFILKESCSMPKIIGIILIVSGLVMTSF